MEIDETKKCDHWAYDQAPYEVPSESNLRHGDYNQWNYEYGAIDAIGKGKAAQLNKGKGKGKGPKGGCHECGGDHYVRDCPLRAAQWNNGKSYSKGQHFGYNPYKGNQKGRSKENEMKLKETFTQIKGNEKQMKGK